MPSRPARRTGWRARRACTRARIRLARGDRAGALADAGAALEFARETAAPFDLFPALAFYARASAGTVAELAESSVTELLDRLAAGQTFWSAWPLPDLVAALGADHRGQDLRQLLEAARPRTLWYDAVCATLDGDQAIATGGQEEGRRHLVAAIEFFRRVGARRALRDAEALMGSFPARAPSTARSRPG